MKRRAKVRCVVSGADVYIGRKKIGDVWLLDTRRWGAMPYFPSQIRTSYPTRAAAVAALVKSWREAGNG